MDADETVLAKQLGARIKEFRRRRGLTQADLAYTAGLTPHYVALLETARKLPSLQALLALAAELETTVDVLLSVPSDDQWVNQIAKLAERVPPDAQRLAEKVLTALVEELKPPAPRSKQRKAKAPPKR